MTTTPPMPESATPRVPNETMRAWAQQRYGGPETVEPVRVPVPTPGPADLLVRVPACGIPAGDARLMRGDPALVRLAFGIRRPRTATRGMDVAGTAPLATLRGLLREGGTVVLVSGAGGKILGPMGRMLKAASLSRRRRRIRPLAATAKPDILAQLLELTDRGGIRPVIERTSSFDAARDALAHVDAGHTVGKVVVTR